VLVWIIVVVGLVCSIFILFFEMVFETFYWFRLLAGVIEY